MNEDISLTFKRGDKHPTKPDLYFWGVDRRLNPPERWISAERLAEKRHAKYLNRKKQFDRGYRAPGRLKPEAKAKQYQRYLVWLAANPEKSKQATRKWRDNNREAASQLGKKWKTKNREKALAGLKTWRRNNPDRYLHYNGVRRAKTKNANSPKETADILLIYKFCRILNRIHRTWAPKGMFHVDHVKPLARGGRHEAKNLRVTTAAYNLAKHDKL